MSEAITLNDLAIINRTLSDKAKYDGKDFEQYVSLIKEYIDNNIFRNDIIVERLISYANESGRSVETRASNTSGVELTIENVNDYLNECKKSIEKALFLKPEIFDLTIFIEVKSIVRYYVEKSYEFDSLQIIKLFLV